MRIHTIHAIHAHMDWKRYIHNTYNTHTYAFSACLGQYIPYIQYTCAYIQYIQYMHIWIEICLHKYIQDTYKIHTIHTHMHWPKSENCMYVHVFECICVCMMYVFQCISVCICMYCMYRVCMQRLTNLAAKNTYNMHNICMICTRYAQKMKAHTYNTYTYIPHMDWPPLYMCMYAVCIAKVYIHIYHSYIPNTVTYVQNFACICMYGMYLPVYACICMYEPKYACCQQQQMNSSEIPSTEGLRSSRLGRPRMCESWTIYTTGSGVPISQWCQSLCHANLNLSGCALYWQRTRTVTTAGWLGGPWDRTRSSSWWTAAASGRRIGLLPPHAAAAGPTLWLWAAGVLQCCRAAQITSNYISRVLIYN
jgi:hypothetical protein